MALHKLGLWQIPLKGDTLTVLGRDVNKLVVIEEARERGLAVKRGTARAVFGQDVCTRS